MARGHAGAGVRGKGRSNALSAQIRGQIVDKFACFEEPAEILAWLKETHGIIITRAALAYYDLDTEWGRSGSAEKWGERFAATRAEFLASERKQAIAHRSYRMAIAERTLRKLLARNPVPYKAVKEMLEYAAKEEGGFFTNKRVIEEDPRGALARLMGCAVDDIPRIGDDGAQP